MREDHSLYGLYREGISLLEEKGFPEASQDAWLLFSHVFGISRATLYASPEEAAPPDKEKEYRTLLEQRLTHVPVQYLTGEAPFWGESYLVSKDTLIPRMDTEVLVEEALSFARKKGNELDILDLCTGTGCILFSLLRELPNSRGVGVDISPGAVSLAKQNAKRLGVSCEMYEGDLFGAKELLGRRFDLIVSNPPYIASSEIMGLMEEVRLFEPALALDGGEDGLLFYRRIIAGAKQYLKEGAGLLMEIGCSQGEAVSALCRQEGYGSVHVVRDLSGLDRVVTCVNEV